LVPNYCYITRAKQGGIYIEAPYDEDFVDALKRHIPPEHRRWDAALKQWWVSEKYEAQARLDARAFFEDVMET